MTRWLRRSCRRWPRPRWSCRSPPPGRSRPAAPRSTGSGGSGWNARNSSATGRGASISWPSPRTAWWPASSSASGKPRWPNGHIWVRSTSDTSGSALAGDVPARWAAPTTTVADRKRLLRAVIESVQVTADGATEHVHATVTWAGGHQTHTDLSRPVARIDQLSYYPALTERIRALAGAGLGNAAIAGQLALDGFRTPHLHEHFHAGEIQHLIRR